MAFNIQQTAEREKTVKATLQEERVCMMGLGYVGLTLGLALAEVGVKVYGVDKNPSLVATLNQRKGHFYERGLDALLRKYLGTHFYAGESLPADAHCNFFIISVGTPLNERQEPNLKFVESCAEEIGRQLRKEDTVILRSTVPIGTTRKVALPILEKVSGLKAGEDFSLVFAPERTVEGNALREIRELPQIIGGLDEKSFIKASNLFRKTTHTIINVSSVEGAEMVKIMDNTSRDLNFAISNELALICEKLDLDAVELIQASNMGYNRNNIPLPSPGVGGACLSKDPYILLDVAKKVGHDSKLIHLGRKINEYMPEHVAEQTRQFFKRHKKNVDSKIFILGFAFKAKPLTSDTRNSPTEILVKKLKEFCKNIHGYDPAVTPETISKEFGVTPAGIEEGFENADAVILMLNNDCYRDLDIFALLAKTKKPTFFYDGWQLFKPADIASVEGIEHGGTGFA